MKVKTVINKHGEQQGSCIEIPLQGKGGALGMYAVENLTLLINGLKGVEKPEDIINHWHLICGFTMCCKCCGFLTEQSADDLMHTVEALAEIELERAKNSGHL